MSYSVLGIFHSKAQWRTIPQLPDNSYCPMPGLRWVHTCNVTMFCYAVTLRVTDTIRSYDPNFHPAPRVVTVSCDRYAMGFPVCYRSQNHHERKWGERSGRWWCVTWHVQNCSGHKRIIPFPQLGSCIFQIMMKERPTKCIFKVNHIFRSNIDILTI
jgi:hypothetical protein